MVTGAWSCVARSTELFPADRWAKGRRLAVPWAVLPRERPEPRKVDPVVRGCVLLLLLLSLLEESERGVEKVVPELTNRGNPFNLEVSL